MLSFEDHDFLLSLQSDTDCVSESLYKSYERGPSYGNYQPAVYNNLFLVFTSG